MKMKFNQKTPVEQKTVDTAEVTGNSVKQIDEAGEPAETKFGEDAIQGLKESAHAAMEDARGEMARLQDWGAASGGKLDGRARETMDELREKRDLAQGKLEQLLAASGDSWSVFRDGIVSAMGDLKKACDRSRDVFRTEINSDSHGHASTNSFIKPETSAK